MRRFGPGLIALILAFALAPGGVLCARQPQGAHLLVLSELEERIAGELAVVMLEQRLAQQGARLIPDARVSAIGRAVAAHSDRPHLRYTFWVIEGDVPPRAFSLPGGRVFVSRSLLERVCQADGELAFMLGHEIAHSALRHYADYALLDGQQAAYVRDVLQRRQPFGLLADNPPLFDAPSSSPPPPGSGAGFSAVEHERAAYAVEQILLPYLRKIRHIKEFEADQFGALYALRAGYDFSGSLRVLQRVRQLYGEDFALEGFDDALNHDAPGESADYPAISARLEQLELFRAKALEAAKLFPLGRDALDRGDYREAALVFEAILSLFPHSRTAQIGLGVAYHLQYWDSAPGDDYLLAYPGALELEYLYLLERGPRDLDALYRARDLYQQALAAEPGNSYAHNNLAVALAELGQAEQAEHTLREALRISAQDFTMFNLGLVLVRQAAVAVDAERKATLQAEALALLTNYLQLIPHDQVAAEYVRALHEQTAE
jgi:Zn-dependent protease with chaperone function